MKKLNHRHKNSIHSSGFTILELIIVIVIIGILAAVTITTYIGTVPSSRDTSVQSDIDAMDALQTNYGVNTMKNAVSGKAYYSGNGYDADLGFRPSNGDVIDVVINSTDYCIRGFNTGGTKNSIWNAFTKESTPGVCDTMSPSMAILGSCPSGFITVPGSSTYHTSDFCVMKYEAKNAGGNVPVSTAAGTPFVSKTQTEVAAYSQNVAGCTGCHLITEVEWMTIAQNVLNVNSNWDNGSGVHTVGTGYIYGGHNDNAPGNALVADPSDANGYAGTGNVANSNQKRTLILSNDQVIWDLAGNVWEQTSGTMTGGQPTGMASWNYYQWTAVSGGTFTVNPYPSGTGISGSNTWDSTKGIGQIYGLTSDASLRGFVRSGNWGAGGVGGVLALYLGSPPSGTNIGQGFRVSR